jgi:hypothetical protein
MKRKKYSTTRASASSAASHRRRPKILESPPLRITKIATDDPNALTLLVAPRGELLTKFICADGSEVDYGNPTWFIAAPVDVSTTAKIVALAKELARRPQYAITYGTLDPNVKSDVMILRRNAAHHPDDGNFHEVPRLTYLLDLDLHDIMLPDDFDRRDLCAAASLARQQLPAAFHNVEMIFVASSGYLRKPGLRFRCWVRLSRPLTPSQFRLWMKLTKPAGRKKPVVDTTPCQTVGLNYTASPVFEDASMDPLPNGRIVVLPGNPTANPPPPAFFNVAKSARSSRTKEPRTPKSDNRKPQNDDAEKESAATADLDETFAHLWNDDVAVDAAREYLKSMSGGVQGEGRHDAAVGAFMRLLDIGLTPETAGDLMFELWSPKCTPPYIDRDELQREVVGLECAREKPIGHAHPNAFETPPTEEEETAGPSLDDATPIEMDFMSHAEGEKRLAEAIQATIADFLRWNPEQGAPPAVGQRATVAAGKTERMLRATFGALFLVRRRRGKRGRRVAVIGVPTHKLSAELENRFNNIVAEKIESLLKRARGAGMLPHTVARIGRWANLKAATWRGREADAPDGAAGEKMCLDLETVRAAQKLQQDIEGKVCKRCEHRDKCAYRAQYKKRADLWIVAHQTLFGSKPKPFPAAGVEFVVIDETVDKAALRGLGANEQIIVKVAELAPGATPLPWKMGSANARRLETLRASLGRALDRMRQRKDSRYVQRAALQGCGITAEDALWAVSAERRRIYRGEDPFLLEANRSVGAFVRMWKALAELLREGGPEVSGRLELRVLRDGGKKVCELRIIDYDEIHPDFRRPTLLIDAAFDAARVKPLFPNILELDPINIDAPHARIFQSSGRSSAKSMLLPQPPLNPEKGFTENEIAENLTRENNRKALRANIVNLARRAGQTLVITYKDLIPLLDLPAPIETANFNAVAGRDCWRDFDLAIVIGRPMPAPQAVESIAAAITGQPPTEVDRWYDKAKTAQIVRLPNGVWAVDVAYDRHPDETAELHRLRICEEEIIQAIGRLRPVRRTADRAATILILNDTPLRGQPIDGWFGSDTFYRTSPVDRMFASGGIAFESPTDAVKAYPGLWPSIEAARKALRRTTGQTPNKESQSEASLYLYIGKCPLVRVRYKLAGPKQHFKHATADLCAVCDPRAELERLLGPLAHFEILPDGPDEPVMPFAALPTPIELALYYARLGRYLETPDDSQRAA